MNRIRKIKRRWFFVSLFCSVSLAVSIPGIVLLAVNGHLGWMAVPIVFAAFGFYGTPLFWIGYANRALLARLVSAVENGIRSVAELSLSFGWSQRRVAASLRTCILRGYLPGYRFDGTTVRRSVVVPPPPNPEKLPVAAICPSCGASAEITPKRRRCEFCGGQIPYPKESAGSARL